MSFTLTIDGSEQRLHFVWAEAAGVWAAEVAGVAAEAVRARAPVAHPFDPNPPVKPGALRRSIAPRIETAAGTASVVIYSTVPYALFVVGGTKPHPIQPRNARMLHFWTAGGEFFRPYVNHPGTKPNPFAAQAIEPLTPYLIDRFARAAREAVHT